MESCLFDRIDKREEVNNFLKNINKKSLYIQYQDNKDCPEHFAYWIRDYIQHKYEADFIPLYIRVNSRLFQYCDHYNYLYNKVDSFKGFKSFKESYTAFNSQNLAEIKKVIEKNKIEFNSNPTKSLASITNYLSKIYITSKQYEPEKDKILKENFYEGLKEHPNLIFIVHIDAYLANKLLIKFEEMVPSNPEYKNKFIFLIKRLDNNLTDLIITDIEELQVSKYLQTNQTKLRISDEQISQFKDTISYPAKYSTIRSKAVKEIGFSNIKNFHKSTNF